MGQYDLRDAKAGDAVCVSNGGWGGLAEKRIVSKTTATQVVLDDGTRWLRRGKEVGAGKWSRRYARPWDEEEHKQRVEEARQRSLRNRLRDVIWARIDDATVAAVAALVLKDENAAEPQGTARPNEQEES